MPTRHHSRARLVHAIASSNRRCSPVHEIQHRSIPYGSVMACAIWGHSQLLWAFFGQRSSASFLSREVAARASARGHAGILLPESGSALREACKTLDLYGDPPRSRRSRMELAAWLTRWPMLMRRLPKMSLLEIAGSDLLLLLLARRLERNARALIDDSNDAKARCHHRAQHGWFDSRAALRFDRSRAHSCNRRSDAGLFAPGRQCAPHPRCEKSRRSTNFTATQN